MDYYEKAYQLIRGVIDDHLLNDTGWYWESEGTQKELDHLRLIISSVKEHIG